MAPAYRAPAEPRTRRRPHSLAPRRARRCGVMPPLLVQQERLREQVERRTFPLRLSKTPILRLRLDQRPRAPTGREVMQRRFNKLTRAAQGILGDLHSPLRRRRQMRSPIDMGKRQGNRRDAAGQPRQHRMERAIGLIRLWLPPSVNFGRLLGRWFARDNGTVIFTVARSMGAARQPRYFSLRQGRYRLHGFYLFPIGRLTGLLIHDSRKADQFCGRSLSSFEVVSSNRSPCLNNRSLSRRITSI